MQRVSREETASYARARPRARQISVLASPQSRTIASRELLERSVAEIAALYEGAELPVPVVEAVLADYVQRGDGGWRVERLAP